MTVEIRIDPKTGTTEILYNAQKIITKVEPVLFYNEEWLFGQEKAILFTKTVTERHEGPATFEGNLFFPSFVDHQVHYSAHLEKESFSVIVHLYLFPGRDMLYLNADLTGNGPLTNVITGYLDLGVPQNITGFRFFHGSSSWHDPLQIDTQKNPSLGMEFFNPRQNAWQEPCYLDQIPNNEALPISFMLGKLKTTANASIAFVPVNRYGQRTIIRCSPHLEKPLGLKFVSGNYIINQKSDHMAGGLIQFGDDPIILTESVLAAYMHLVNRPHVLRQYKEYPEAFEYLGFCTWNTFYQAVDMNGMNDLAAENFTKEKGTTRFKYLIVDDGWQSITGCDITPEKTKESHVLDRGLRHFEANHKFPKGIGEVVKMLKGEYGFKWVGVWHAVGGYWPGVEPNSELGKRYDILVNNGSGYPNPIKMSGYEFWADYYKHLRASGIDLLKIDNQCSLGPAFAGKIALDNGIENHYIMQQGAAYAHNLVILNCMCMASDNKIHWTKSNVSRVSDDFYPGNLPTSKHQIKQCTFNPLYYASFCWPDHDMFQTNSDVWASLVLIHMVSGGPVYIADEVGETKAETVNKLCFPDGRLPRLDRPGMPTNDTIYGDTDIDTACKMWNYHDLAGWGRVIYYFATNMLGKDQDISTKISPAHVGKSILMPSLMQSLDQTTPEGYVVRDQDSDAIWTLKSVGDEISVDLENMESKYFLISPIFKGIALLGIAGMYNGTKAISAARFIGPRKIEISMDYTGILWVYTSHGKEIHAHLADDTALTINKNPKNDAILGIEAPVGTFYIDF